MADDGTLNIKISATIKDLTRALEKAEKEIGEFGGKTEQTFEKAAKSTEPLAKGVNTSSAAMRRLDSATQGVSGALVNVGKAATKTGTAMRSALIASGVGALLVALQLVVQYWDDIKGAITGATKALKIYTDKINSLLISNKSISQQIQKIKALQDQYEALGKSIIPLQGEERALYVKQLSNITAQRKTITAELRKLTALYQESGLDEDETKRLYDLEAQLGTLQIETTSLETSIISLDNELSTMGEVALGAKRDMKELGDEALITKGKFDSAFTGGIIKGDFGKSLPFNTILAELKEFDESVPEFLHLPKVDTKQVAAETEKLKQGLTAMELEMINFNERMSAIIRNTLTNTFTSLGEVIGKGLAGANDAISGIDKLLLSTLGGLLTQLGAMAIEVGVGLLAITTAFKTLNPYVAIAAGIALVALGAYFTTQTKKIPDSGGGGSSIGSGIQSSSGSSGTGTGTSVNYNNSGGGSGGTFVFEIQGTKLIGVIRNTLNRNRSLGGDNIIAAI